jgi:hypothetical protein
LECADLERAERMAAQSAASIGRDLLPKGHVRDVMVEVRNEHKQRVLTATVTMKTERWHPEPSPPPV